MNNKNNTHNLVKISNFLDKIVMAIGHIVMWTNGILIFVIILQVILRYGFGHGLVIFEELQWHLYAVGIMFGASYAMTNDSHIRVDIIHAQLSKKWKIRWDLFGIFFLLLPFVIIIFHQSLDFVYESFRVSESSDAPMGLPYRWIIKGVIPLSFSLLALSVVSRTLRLIHCLKKDNHGI